MFKCWSAYWQRVHPSNKNSCPAWLFPPGTEHQPWPTHFVTRISTTGPTHKVDYQWWSVFLPYTNVTHATDVNMLLWHHQQVLHHYDWLCIPWSHCHDFVDKLSTPSSTRPLKRLRWAQNLRSGSRVDSFCFFH